MKILIAYDGLHPAEWIISDLKRAGLPHKAEVLVLSAANVLVPAPPETPEVLAANAAFEIRKAFPHWKVEAEASGISPLWAIAGRAKKRGIDLVVVGSHDAGPVAKSIYGSLALKVMKELPCSVRIVRRSPEETDSPARIVIGADGSRDCERAVREVSRRDWKPGTSVHLITVMEPSLTSSVMAVSSAVGKWVDAKDVDWQLWIHRMIRDFENQLKIKGLTVSSILKEGDPKRILPAEAQAWGADCIFLGALGLSRAEGLRVGAVSESIAAKASCTIEIVRQKEEG